MSAEFEVVMPPLGDAAGELVVSAWLKAVGDPVAKGEDLFQVATDKVEVNVEALDWVSSGGSWSPRGRPRMPAK